MMNAALNPLDQAEVALIVAVGGGCGQFALRAAEGSRVAAGLRRAEHPARSCCLTEAERGRAVEESCRRRRAAAAACSFPGALKVVSGGLVGTGGGLGLVPCSLVWLGRAGDCCEAGVHALALGEGRPVVHRGADQRVAEADQVADRDQLPRLSGCGRLDREAEFLAGLPQKGGITGWVGGSGEEQGLGIGRQSLDLPEVTLLELVAQWHRLGQG